MFTQRFSRAVKLSTLCTGPYRAPVRHSSSVHSTLYYLQQCAEYRENKPYYINVPEGGIPGHQTTNEISEAYHNIPIHSLRGKESDFTLDRNGFQIVRDDGGNPDESILASLPYERYADAKTVLRSVGPAVETCLRRTLDAEVVLTFTLRLRRRDPQFPARSRGTNPEISQPVQGVHVDFTPDYAHATALHVAKTHNISLDDRRWQILSLWRPLFGPLQDWPLAILDHTSMEASRDLIASDNIYPHEIRETYNVFFNEKHRWYFLDNHEPNELLIFKAYDSKAESNLARVCAHAAFMNPIAPPDARPRESMECLSLVVYPRGTAAKKRPEELLPSESLEFVPPRNEVRLE